MKLPDFAVEAVSLITGAKMASEAGDPDAGQAVANFVKNNLHNLVNQFTTQRQAKRIKDVSQYALNGIKHRLENDEKLRDDGFFERTIDRSNAEESFEAVLLKAQDEFEEKKIPYLGNNTGGSVKMRKHLLVMVYRRRVLDQLPPKIILSP